MNRLPIIAAALALLGAAAFFVLYSPESRTANAVPEVRVDPIDATVVRPAPARRLAADSAVDVPRPSVAPDAAIELAVDAEVVAPKGPYTVKLGTHTVVLRERDQAVTITLEVVARDDVTRKEVQRRRRHLVRMLYFLASHRAGAGALLPDAKARFQADLLTRYRNVIKTGPLLRMKISDWSVEAWSPPDAGD